jgi:hypothetical protein
MGSAFKHRQDKKIEGRFGKFVILLSFYKKFPEICQMIMGECELIFDAQLDSDFGCIKYQAVCDKFDMTTSDYMPMYSWGTGQDLTRKDKIMVLKPIKLVEA